MDGTRKLPVSKRRRVSPSHQRSREQERECAEKFGGKVTKGSGSGYQKADVQAELVRVEAKTTKHDSFRVTVDMIEKLEADAFGADVIPMLEIELGLGKKKVYVVPDWAVEMLVDASKKS
jgi:Holliday junction resolvase